MIFSSYFITHDARGNLVTRKVPIIIGNLGETYVLIEQGVGSALEKRQIAVHG
ncbi:hypothetical protein N7524_008683 [Penicillium chrysogenum]|nr:hypothetical protein N7524_008683 [Penicillium chrysogenum]